MSEAHIKAAVLEALKPLEAARRCKVMRMNSGVARGGKIRLGTPGTPDILVLLRDGGACWLEIKRPGNWKRSSNPKTIAAQAAWRADAEALGHTVHTITSAQDALTAVLEERMR